MTQRNRQIKGLGEAVYMKTKQEDKTMLFIDSNI